VVGLNFLLHIFHIRFKDKKLQSDSLGAMTEFDDLNTRNVIGYSSRAMAKLDVSNARNCNWILLEQ
jgi:hypothetical protein